MKNINRLLAAAAILLSAAACHTNEIDPVKPDPVNPGESGLTITANIVKTRVTYNDRNEDYLDQQWDEGDILFGYYGGDVDNKVILTVSGFDEAENAILIPAEDVGAATLKDLAKLEDDVPVDLVYIGANVSAAAYPFDTDGNLTIDMSPKDGVQDGVNIPACMHARAYVQTDKNDPNKKSLFFKFVNDCAIIEICSLTGLKEEEIDGGALTSLSVTNLVLAGEYTLGKDGFEFGASEIVADYDDVPVVTDYVKYFETNDWSVDSDGIISGGNAQERYLLAVVPNIYINDITVSATIDGSTETYSFDYGNHDFDAGKCYVIRDADVVAKTVDGLYFTTVKAAFDHAHEIRLDHLDDNTVTLVKDEIYGLVNHDDSESVEQPIEITIDYPVTLDLNGCLLCLGNITYKAPEWDWEQEDVYDDDLDISEYFFVDDDGEFTITDLSDCEKTGAIYSVGNNAESIIINEETVVIKNGEITQLGSDYNEEPGVIDNYSSLSVEGGSLYSWGYVIEAYNGSKTTIGTESGDGPSIDSSDITISIQGGNTSTAFTMTGGIVNGEFGGVSLNGENVIGEVSGGSIKSSGSSSTALCVDHSTCIISGGDVNNTGAGVSYAVKLVNNAKCTIEGGMIDGNAYSYAIYCNNSNCIISGGTITTEPQSQGDEVGDIVGIPAIYCSTTETSPEKDYSFNMSGGDVRGYGTKIILDENIKGKITGGTIQTTRNHAIKLFGAVLDIDGADNTINITNGYSDHAPISWSTISVDKYSKCNISGKKTSVFNYCGHAVEIRDGKCTLSGGSFITESDSHSAVFCYSSEIGDTPGLTIEWAQGSIESDEHREGPLIVVQNSSGQQNHYGAVSTRDLYVKGASEQGEGRTYPNYAKVEISGGYLYSNDGAVFSKSSTSDVSIANCYTNLGSMVVGGGLTHSPYYEDGTQYIDSICLDPNQVQIGGYGFMFKITPGEKPDSDIPGSADPLGPIGKIEL